MFIFIGIPISPKGDDHECMHKCNMIFVCEKSRRIKKINWFDILEEFITIFSLMSNVDLL